MPDDGVTRYQDGESALALAGVYGVTPRTVKLALKRQGVDCRGCKEASAFTDHTAMHEANAALRATGELHRRVSATNQGIGREEWTGYTTTRWQRVINTKEWKAWRMAVFTRDGFHCSLCGSASVRGRKLQAHHIRPKSKYPELVFDVSNGITLCAPCHRTTFGKEAEFESAFFAILAERAA